jgi:hypothetical protein
VDSSPKMSIDVTGHIKTDHKLGGTCGAIVHTCVSGQIQTH